MTIASGLDCLQDEKETLNNILMREASVLGMQLCSLVVFEKTVPSL